MNESDRRQRVISSTPRLSTDEIANRAFAKGVRGFSETEVRAFLKRVAEELAVARACEDELASAVDALEEQLRTPRPLSEQELLDALGDETARLLRSAREASDDIRKKAEERAARLVDDALGAADRTRAEAAELLASRASEAETRAGELVSSAEARATSIVETANGEADVVLEGARRQGREMLDEAKAARERVLGDLVRRRALLSGQIEALRGGRDRLLDAYRTVKRTFLEATESLAQVEARAAVERSAMHTEVVDVAAEIEAEIEQLDAIATSEAASAALDAPDADAASEATDDAEGAAPSASDTAPGSVDDSGDETALADVDSLFARLRAGHDEVPPTGEGPATDAAAGGTQAPDGTVAEPQSGAAGEAVSSGSAGAGGQVGAQEWRARRAHVVDPLLGPLLKRAKRRAQDDQNALLDAVRRHKGRPSAEQVLGAGNDAGDAWSKLLRDAVDRAYGAGRTAAGAPSAPAGDELVAASADAIAAPLRERLTAAIDSGDADPGGLVERIGARYREWKNQSLERVLGEVLACAWTRGVYDAVPDQAVLWWIPAIEGRCSDCDDNALEPTVKGKDFPTGQPHPPAHPGCTCLLAPAGMVEGR